MRISLPNEVYPSILVYENFLSDSELDYVVRRCKTLKMYIDENVPERISSREDLLDVDTILSSHLVGRVASDVIPTEYRIYFEGSKGFTWHKDQFVEEIKGRYYEASLTLTDTSDCKFEYIKDGTIYSMKVKPNTIVLVKPNDIVHRVSPLNTGRRTFLKFCCMI